jgi:mRNA interferase RelE/StbE
MNEYQILFARAAAKELEALPTKLAIRILESIEGLEVDPRPPGCKKLEGSEDLWRIRKGDYRVLYSIDDERRIVDIIAVRHRRDAYR